MTGIILVFLDQMDTFSLELANSKHERLIAGGGGGGGGGGNFTRSVDSSKMFLFIPLASAVEPFCCL